MSHSSLEMTQLLSFFPLVFNIFCGIRFCFTIKILCNLDIVPLFDSDLRASKPLLKSSFQHLVVHIQWVMCDHSVKVVTLNCRFLLKSCFPNYTFISRSGSLLNVPYVLLNGFLFFLSDPGLKSRIRLINFKFRIISTPCKHQLFVSCPNKVPNIFFWFYVTQ